MISGFGAGEGGRSPFAAVFAVFAVFALDFGTHYCDDFNGRVFCVFDIKIDGRRRGY